MTALARAQVLVDLGRHTEARAALAPHLANEPDSLTGLYLLAQCELALGDSTAALAAADRAIAVAPEAEWALRLRALALADLGRHRAAREAAKAAIRIDPGNWLTHYVLAIVSQKGAFDEAYPAARRAVELAPHEAEAHVMVGITAAGLGHKKEARAAYHEALRLDPESATALNNLAAMDINRARLGSAARNVTAGLRVDPSAALLQRNLDVVVLRLMSRLLNLMLLTGFLPMVLIAGAAHHAWWARASVGAVQVTVYTVVIWSTARHLPRGATRHLRGLPRRMTGGQRVFGVVLVLLAVALLFMAFAPGSLWLAGAGVLALMIRGFQLLLVFWVISWVARKLRGKP
jgi:tetratricopeptide (TPR) repeat protein